MKYYNVVFVYILIRNAKFESTDFKIFWYKIIARQKEVVNPE